MLHMQMCTSASESSHQRSAVREHDVVNDHREAHTCQRIICHSANKALLCCSGCRERSLQTGMIWARRTANGMSMPVAMRAEGCMCCCMAAACTLSSKWPRPRLMLRLQRAATKHSHLCIARVYVAK